MQTKYLLLSSFLSEREGPSQVMAPGQAGRPTLKLILLLSAFSFVAGCATDPNAKLSPADGGWLGTPWDDRLPHDARTGQLSGRIGDG